MQKITAKEKRNINKLFKINIEKGYPKGVPYYDNEDWEYVLSFSRANTGFCKYIVNICLEKSAILENKHNTPV